MEKSQDLPEICINQKDTQSPPEPSKDIARFLGWLMKLGGVQDLKRCEKKWERKRLNVEESIKNLNVSFIRIQTLRGEKVVVLVDWAWADRWVTMTGASAPSIRRVLNNLTTLGLLIKDSRDTQHPVYRPNLESKKIVALTFLAYALADDRNGSEYIHVSRGGTETG